MPRTTLTLGLVLTLCTAPACQQTDERPRPGPAPAASPGQPVTAQPPPTDPVALATLRERALTLLASAAANGPPEERANAIEGLQSAPARLAPLLEPALADRNLAVRSVAAMAVGRAKIVGSAPLVRPLLSDPAPQVRACAAYALARCGERADLSPIAELLFSPGPRDRSLAAFLLGDLGEPSALGPLKEAGRQSLPRAEGAILRVLDLQLAEARIKLGDDSPLPEVRAALFPAKTEDLESTALACQVLGGVRDQASTRRLIALVGPHARDGTQAVPAGEEGGAGSGKGVQLMPAEVRLAAASALAKLGQRHGAYIADAYRTDRREALRVQAALVYGDVGEPRNLPLLVDMMNDPAGRVRVAAATAVVRVTEGGGRGG